jgi:transmembrane sensor
MEAPTEPARQTPSRQANRWWILLQEEPHDEVLRRRLDLWRSASAENEEAWLEVERLHHLASYSHSHSYAAQGAGQDWQRYLAERRAASSDRAHAEPARPDAGASARVNRRWRSARPRLIMAGAVAALAAMLAFVWVPVVLVNLQSDHVTSTAEVRSITLDDGSTVTLAADSAIAVSFYEGERRVKLLRGEAFFQVASDARRSFKVIAGTVQATVVGTEFDVRLAAGDVTVDVAEGVVAVGQVGATDGERLGAGQSVSIGSKGKARLASLPPQFVGAWRQGRLLTAEVPLRDAVEQLRRHFDGAIVLTDAALGDRPITGAYTLSEPESALRAIAKAHGAVVRRVTPWLLVISSS